MLVAVRLALLLLAGATSATAQNLLSNPGFESGTTGWSGWGAVTLTSSTALPHTGSRSALVQNRTATWNGVGRSVLGLLQPTNTYRLSAWARLVSGGPQPIKLTMHKVDGGGTAYDQVASGTASATNWTRLFGGYVLPSTGALTALNLYLEGPPAGVSLYADDFLVEAYDWRAEANAGIEQNRKREVQLRIVDVAGQPIPATGIAVQQTRHQFAFGSAINYRISNPTYAAFFRTNFPWAVMENESKWYANEPSRSNVTYTAANAITNYCFTNGITLRGHTLLWAVEANVQSWVKGLSDADLRVHLTNRLRSAVTHFRGTFPHWDVNNEMLHGDYYGGRLGAWVNPWMFQYAHALAPEVKLFVNDYNVVSGNETEAYRAQILALLAAGTPVQGVGAQGHFGAVVNPALTSERLDRLAELGLPLWITEYDSENADENVRAENLEKVYRIAFSKPAVAGILMWGFWAGSHWRGSNAAIVNLDWTLNAAGRRYQALLAEWTTRTNGVADSGGAWGFRGVHGDYEVVLTPSGGQPTRRRFTLVPGAGPQVVTLIAHRTGAQPVLHHAERAADGGSFRFQLTGDAGRKYVLERAPQAADSSWLSLATVSNATGTLWFTNSGPLLPAPAFFRARLWP